MIEQDKHQTAVIFRKCRKSHGGGIIALFPGTPAGTCGQYVMSFEHVGHHGAANYSGVIAKTIPATEEEYGDLMRELESLGYNLVVHKRQTARMRAKCYGKREGRMSEVKTHQERLEEQVRAVSDVANQLSPRSSGEFAEMFTREHRTLQNFTRLCVAWLEELAKPEARYDLRNEASVRLAREFMAKVTERGLPYI